MESFMSLAITIKNYGAEIAFKKARLERDKERTQYSDTLPLQKYILSIINPL